MFPPADPGKKSTLLEGAGHYCLLFALVNDRCFRIWRHGGSFMDTRWAGQTCSPNSHFFCSKPWLSSLSVLCLTLSTLISISQFHLETQGLEDGKSKNKHLPFSDLFNWTLSLLRLAEAMWGEVAWENLRIVTESQFYLLRNSVA